MEEETVLTLRIDTEKPIELSAFVLAFTSLAAEYQRQTQEIFPEADAKIYVKEVRKGSYEADLIPYIPLIAPIIASVDQVMIIEQFVTVWGKRISALVTGKLGDWEPTKNDLKTLSDATEAIARDPNASSTLEAVHFRDGKREVEAFFKFTTADANKAKKTIEDQTQLLELHNNEIHERVLMVFTRTDIGNAQVGKRSGEKVVIEEISPKAFAIMYASSLAEERIKHEIREDEGNVYMKGFVVDVSVKTVNGRPSVYAITHVHDIIELPDNV